jgi:undecaprenyl-diphosphatase
MTSLALDPSVKHSVACDVSSLKHHKRLLYTVAAAASTVFATLAYNVLAKGPFVTLDASIASTLHAHATPAVTQAMLLITHAHDPIAIDAYCVVAALIFARVRQWIWACAFLLVVPGGLLINGLIKRVFERARPVFDDPLMSLATFSFPSGHTAGATLLYGMVTAYVITTSPRFSLRCACLAFCAFMITLVGLSRIYLGVHYLSDILGAAAWSIAFLALCMTAVLSLNPARGAPH